MTRVATLDRSELTAQQQQIYDDIAGARGRVGGPFGIWLRQPKLADAANKFGNLLRVEGKLDKRLFELMTIIVARHWSAQYEWFVHESAARKAGISDDVVAAIRARRRPNFTRDDERLVYDVVTELNETRTVSEQSYEHVLSAFGLDLTIEFFTATGFYIMVAVMLNAFDVSTPDDTKPLA